MSLDPNFISRLRVGNINDVRLPRLHNTRDDTAVTNASLTLDVTDKKTGAAVANAQGLSFTHLGDGEYLASIPADAELTAGSTYTLVVSGTGYRDEVDVQAVRS